MTKNVNSCYPSSLGGSGSGPGSTFLSLEKQIRDADGYEELSRVGLVDEYGPKGYKQVSISGRELRETLRKGELPIPGSCGRRPLES
jgi:hypothetical protein